MSSNDEKLAFVRAVGQVAMTWIAFIVTGLVALALDLAVFALNLRVFVVLMVMLAHGCLSEWVHLIGWPNPPASGRSS